MRYLVTVTEEYEIEADDEGHALFLADWPHRSSQKLTHRDYDARPFPGAVSETSTGIEKHL